MMRQLYGRAVMLLAILAVTFTAACVATPSLDTQNKQAYAAELAVQQMLSQVDAYEQAGKFSDEEWADVRVQLVRLRQAYAALETSQAVGEDIGPNLETVYTVLVLLRQHVE